jgi:hypothetical protein
MTVFVHYANLDHNIHGVICCQLAPDGMVLKWTCIPGGGW